MSIVKEEIMRTVKEELISLKRQDERFKHEAIGFLAETFSTS